MKEDSHGAGDPYSFAVILKRENAISRNHDYCADCVSCILRFDAKTEIPCSEMTRSVGIGISNIKGFSKDPCIVSIFVTAVFSGDHNVE
jgi:hypothetical protein